jgi:membrane protein YdbS with pleckstrin-like domain
VRRHLIVLPINRIQHVETHRNAIERRLNLSTLRLYTAGGSSADLTVHGLEREIADKIRETVLQEIHSEEDEST